jgi:hypothetical protein
MIDTVIYYETAINFQTYKRFFKQTKMKHNVISIKTIIACTILFTTLVLQSCKKDSDATNGNNPSGYYLTANVNGSSWASNVNTTLNNAPALAAITTTNGVTVVVMLGIKAVNKDSSGIVVIFPKNATLNKSYDFDASQYSEGAYAAETTPGSATYNGYNTLPVTGGSGSFTITSFDETAMTIEGTFSGTFGSQTGKPAVQITNGKFRCPYTTNINQLPKSGGLKY